MEKKIRFKHWKEKHKNKMLRVVKSSFETETTTEEEDDYDSSPSPSVYVATDTLSVNYIVHIKLISGHNLAVRDWTGTSDPYVKFKHGKYKARSTIIDADLNPIWNEEFIFQTKDLLLPLRVRVYDHDIISSDDFMGEGYIDLKKYRNTNRQEKLIIKLTDQDGSLKNLGFLRLELQISPMTYEDQCAYQLVKYRQLKKKNTTSRSWHSLLTVTLLGANDLPAMDSNGFSDPYCKFKLGTEKFKSKVQTKTLNPEWKQQFNMKLYDGQSRLLYIEVWDRDFPAADDFIGGCSVDLSQYEPEIQHDLTVQLNGSESTLHLHLVITGLSCQEENITTIENKMKLAENDYKLFQFVKLWSLKNIGLLHITIDRAADLHNQKGNNFNSFVMVEVGNEYLRTQSILDTSDPIWNKTFSFFIKDIHDIIYIRVFNEKNQKEEFLGQVIIPLLKILNGSDKTYVLKDKRCLNRASGTITVKGDVIYNSVRAGLRTIQPREESELSEDPKFRWKVLKRNIQRTIDLINPILQIIQFIQGILSWNDPLKSIFAVMVFMAVCLLIKIWIVFFLFILIFLTFYVVTHFKKDNLKFKKAYQRAALQASDLNSDNESDFSDLEDYVHSEKNSSEIKSFRQHFRQLQEILFTVQKTTGYITDLAERTRNLFHWSVPFLCWMAIVVFLFAMILTYHVHLRYIILIWGLHKMTKRLWRPRAIPNNEILDFLSRAPTDLELLKWKELKLKDKKNK